MDSCLQNEHTHGKGNMFHTRNICMYVMGMGIYEEHEEIQTFSLVYKISCFRQIMTNPRRRCFRHLGCLGWKWIPTLSYASKLPRNKKFYRSQIKCYAPQTQPVPFFKPPHQQPPKTHPKPMVFSCKDHNPTPHPVAVPHINS